MKQLNNLIIPLVLAAIAMAVILLLPFTVGADEMVTEPNSLTANTEPGLPEVVIGASAVPVIDNGPDIKLSSAQAREPDIAASSQYLAVVYEQGSSPNSQIFLRSVSLDPLSPGWIPFSIRVDDAGGFSPRLVFAGTDKVHIVWRKNGNREIQHATCILTQETATCGTPTTVHSVVAPNFLGLLDITIDSSQRLHVAWINVTLGRVETTLSTNGGASWGTISTVSATNPDKPVLAATSGFIHLFFENSGGNFLQYNRSSTAAHSWVAEDTFFPDAGTSYNRIGNPAVAATSSGNLLLTWDFYKNDSLPDLYALASSLSTNQGSSWATETYITSTNEYGFHFADDISRRSKDSGTTPVQEVGLRPSVAVTGTNEFVVVWQQRPDSDVDCDTGNGTSEIYYAQAAKPGMAPAGNWWIDTVGTLADDVNNYSIDPDIVVDPNGDRHIVYLRAAPTGNCAAGGGVNDYTVYYRGPFTEIQPGGGIYIPIVFKQFQ